MTRAWRRRSPDHGLGYDIPAEALSRAIGEWVEGPRPQTWDAFAEWAEGVRGRPYDRVRVSIWSATWEQQIGELLETARRRLQSTPCDCAERGRLFCAECVK